MTYQKPYTFRAGTYAKAAEVNANFDTVKDFVDDLQDAIGNVEVSKTPYNKANLQGNSDVVFYCATSSEANAAVNNTQLTNSLSDINDDIDEHTQAISENAGAISDLQEAVGNITMAPTYSNGTAISENTTIQSAGILVVKIWNNQDGYITIDGTTFTITNGGMVTFPVKQGTAIGSVNNVYNMYLYAY